MPREKVTVVEVGLRDGLQMLPGIMPTENKIAWLVPALPITFDGVRAAPPRGIPTVGGDTRSVLRDIDLTEVEISELFQSNIIADRPKISEGRGADQKAPSAVTG